MDNQTHPLLRLLLLEDSATDTQLILRQLERDGLNVECRQVDKEADFIAALAWNPDLILSDFSLPHFNGLRALQVTKQHKLDIPFIVVSGAIGEDVIVDVIKQGADDYVMKDHLIRLGSTIRNALEQKRLREEKKRADEALRESEERLNLFFTQSLDGFFFMMLDEPVRWDDTVDKENVLDYAFTHQRITKINDAMLAQYGAKREQFLGLTPADLMAHNLENGRKIWRELFDAGHLDVETDERRFDGSQMWIEGDYVCLYDSEGRITGHFGMQRDVTARRETEEKLRQLSRAVEQSPVTIVITDTQGTIQYVNPKFTQTTGYTAEEALGMNPRILKSGRTSPDEYKTMWDSLTAGSEWRGELQNKKKNGELYWESASISPILNEQGEITHFIGIKEDITTRKQVEENLREAETKFRTLAEQIPPIIYIAELNQHVGVTYISPRIKSLGFTPEEWIGNPDLWLRQIHPEDQDKVKADIERCVQNGGPFLSEYRMLTRDGNVIWLLDEANNVLDGNGKPLYRQGFMLDITRRKIAEETLASREQFMEALNQMTHAILLSKDFDATLQLLAFDITKLLAGDDCYITYWDEERELILPITTTSEFENTFSEDRIFNINEPSLTATVIKAGHVLAVEDVLNSPHMSAESAKNYPARSVLGIPLIAGEHKLGAAVIAYNTSRHFTSEELERARQLGNQIALTLWNYQQGLEIQQRLKQSHTLTNIGRALGEIEHVGSQSVLQLIVDSALDLIPKAEQAVIHIITAEENVLTPMAIAGYPEKSDDGLQTKMQMGKGVAGQVIRDGITINISNVEDDPRFLRTSVMPKFRSLMVAPIQIGGQQIGTISMQSKLISAFSGEDEELLNALATDAAIAIDNTRSFESTQQSLKEVNALYGTIQVLAASLNPEELARDVVALLEKNFGYYYVQFFLLDPLDADLILKAGSGEVGELLLKDQFRMPRGAGIIGHVAETGVPFFTNNVNNVVFFQRSPLLPDTLFELAVPIKVEGEVMGVLDIQDKPPRELSQRDLQLVQAVGDQLAVALHKANLYTDLQSAMVQEQSIRSQLIQSERLALVGRLLASVSHELNNPLQAIQNALFLLQEESGLSAQGRQDLGIVLAETERMAALIERLRSAYRPIRGKDFQPVPLNNLIEDVLALISTHMRHKDIVFEFIPDPELQSVLGISDQLRQVILNLFLNAVEVMGPGGRLTVQTQNLIEQKEVLVTVKDTGPGINAEILPHIFDAFITNKHTGTGLGLTITHDILEQHRGRISAKNNPQGGAIFHVWLPMSEKE